MKQPNSINENQVVVLSVEQLRNILDETIEKAVEKLRDLLPKPVEAEKKQLLADENRYLTRQEASEMFHVDVTTLWRWEKEGLPAFKAGARRVLYKLSDLLTVVKLKGKHNRAGFGDESIEPKGGKEESL